MDRRDDIQKAIEQLKSGRHLDDWVHPLLVSYIESLEAVLQAGENAEAALQKADGLDLQEARALIGLFDVLGKLRESAAGKPRVSLR